MRILFAFVLLVLASTRALAGPLELVLPHLKTFPECEEEKVLASIVEEFNWAERKTWQRGFTMDGIVQPYETSTFPEGRRQIPRRYCRALGVLSDGRECKVYYMVEGGQGFAGTSFNVAWCIVTADPWREYGSGCRVLRY